MNLQARPIQRLAPRSKEENLRTFMPRPSCEFYRPENLQLLQPILKRIISNKDIQTKFKFCIRQNLLSPKIGIFVNDKISFQR
jgi:hypothetical protein